MCAKLVPRMISKEVFYKPRREDVYKYQREKELEKKRLEEKKIEERMQIDPEFREMMRKKREAEYEASIEDMDIPKPRLSENLSEKEIEEKVRKYANSLLLRNLETFVNEPFGEFLIAPEAHEKRNEEWAKRMEQTNSNWLRVRGKCLYSRSEINEKKREPFKGCNCSSKCITVKGGISKPILMAKYLKVMIEDSLKEKLRDFENFSVTAEVDISHHEEGHFETYYDCHSSYNHNQSYWVKEYTYAVIKVTLKFFKE